MRKYLVLMFVALVVGLALPASAFELPTSKPEEPTPGWSVEPVESQELGAASHAGSCDFALEICRRSIVRVSYLGDWPWESHAFFSDDIVAEGAIFLDEFGGGVTDRDHPAR